MNVTKRFREAEVASELWLPASGKRSYKIDQAPEAGRRTAYNCTMQKKIFWMVFALLGLLADFLLPLWWGVAATIPILFIAWWVAYRSDWF